ncbi:MAG: PepSY-associated TM helix domain-containing protein [Asticcacaulis sp.]|uniref:PepSY-associated TM helix domain-containing protein n=1 Tax=Asticcacaulis sp. TaxID=1872648 RepID=UPI0039E2DDDC
MMYWHRLCVILTGLLLTYIVLTGAGIQLADMRALVSHAPETDPDMLMMRQHIYGPPNFSVVSAPDYTAPALPAGLNYVVAMSKAAALGRAAVPGADLRLVELRMAEGKPAAHVRMGDRQLIFDLATGAPLPAADLPPPQPPRDFQAPRATFKYLHRFNYLGQWATGLNGLAGIVFCVLIFTGLAYYVRIYRNRLKLDRKAVFWSAGPWWRDLHRWTAIGAGLLVVWITLTGLALSVDNFSAFVLGQINGPPKGIDPFAGDWSSPMSDSELPAMTRTTLAAFQAAEPGTGIKVLQLRHFAVYAQGVVVANDRNTSQRVFNAANGQRQLMSEPGYPKLGFPFGWEWHQRMKQLHRGDYFGLPGRWLDTIGALAMVYLTLSGLVMYVQLWQRRQKQGRKALIW